MTLTEFLLARIAEDEAAAERVLLDYGGGDLESLEARVLAECEAKRRIVDRYSDDAIWPDYQGGYESATEDAVRDLAAVYADHPDYDDAWRP